mmetsp:Transcript_12090/g.24045  ORF Transcript_12090/g.24045 Transcript_12090/m.24045 type:complete len:202 (+) Transcript_12090:92-697(+)|eukprot:CAMPEP_0182460876 /NCGR_PEP_ID=MMETSP1319-20130603/5610_1 /TAXON_ID=172717 /ORGANISM="Bolidomonas pacifica, Strain RCC208" /LENGTH=201 /DNA_ID=CAMNT_0024660055 /DNA_START=75 /DNA_END=680 /DNA_ORIENTATION=+
MAEESKPETTKRASQVIDSLELQSLKLGVLKAEVKLAEEQSGHPEYTVIVTDTKTLQSREVANRFDAFRKLKMKLEAESKGLITTPFPKTFAKSKVGVKLTKKEVAARVDGLNAWIAECLEKIGSMNEGEIILLSDFMGLKHLSVASATASRAAKVIEKGWVNKKAVEGEKVGGMTDADVKVAIKEHKEQASGGGACCVVS